jgi:hypothetical protein
MTAQLVGTPGIHRLLDSLKGAPALVVLEARRAPGLAESFLSPGPTDAPAGRPLVLRVQLTTVNTPDTLSLVAARAAGTRFEFEVEHRAFEGILGANVQEQAVLEAQLAPLPPGRYEVVVRRRELGFSRLEHPEEAQPRTTTAQTWAFTVKP